MLGKSAERNLETIKAAITNFWGDNCVVQGIDIINGPFPQFEIHLKIYNVVGVGFSYDRGTMDIGIKVGEKYEILQDFTDKTVYRGFEVMQPEIMQHNFSVLDEVAKQLAFGK